MACYYLCFSMEGVLLAGITLPAASPPKREVFVILIYGTTYVHFRSPRCSRAVGTAVAILMQERPFPPPLLGTLCGWHRLRYPGLTQERLLYAILRERCYTLLQALSRVSKKWDLLLQSVSPLSMPPVQPYLGGERILF